MLGLFYLVYKNYKTVLKNNNFLHDNPTIIKKISKSAECQNKINNHMKLIDCLKKPAKRFKYN